MAKKKTQLDQAMLDVCVRCGFSRESHELGNYSDGGAVGRAFLVCPFATFKAPEAADAVARGSRASTK